MSQVLTAAVDFTVATTRWSNAGNDSIYMRTGTIWYGMMCRSFVLLERLLRSCLNEYENRYESLVNDARRRRGFGKRLTMGQSFRLLGDVAPQLIVVLATDAPVCLVDADLFPEKDHEAWEKIVDLRNQMAHEGPGFLDSVDLFSGRMWRKYEVQVPLHQQARAIWELGRIVCRSPIVLTCVGLQGVSAEDALKTLEQAESISFTFREIASKATDVINDFHGSP